MKKNKISVILTNKQVSENLQIDEVTIYYLLRKITTIKLLGQWHFENMFL